MLKKSDIFAVNGTPVYAPDAPFPFACGHLQSNAGRSLSGMTVKHTVRYGVRSFDNLHYSKMTASEFMEMYQLFMQETEFFNFTFWDATICARNTIPVYCNNCSGSLQSVGSEGIVTDVTFTLVQK